MNPPIVSVRIVGNWNPKIFTPLWIKENLFETKDEEEIDVSVNFEDVEFSFKFKDIVIHPKEKSVDIVVDGFTVENLNALGDMSCKLLRLLPQTPLKGLGVNFKYTFKDSEKSTLVSNFEKIQTIENFKPQNFTQSYNKENYQLNLVIAKQIDGDTSITFNFHYSPAEILTLENKFVGSHFNECEKIINR